MRSKYIAAAALLGLALFLPLARHYGQTRNAAVVVMPEAVGFRILFQGGTAATWDGSIVPSGARILSIQGWRFADDDRTDGHASWKAATRHGPPYQKAGPIFDNGVFVFAAIESPAAQFDVTTAQGAFTFRAGQLPPGAAVAYLDGRVSVEGVPNVLPLSSSYADQDFPAVAQKDDDVYVSYVEFSRSPLPPEVAGLVQDPPATLSNQLLSQEPASFRFLARPAGGDQVMLLRYSKSGRAWDEPMPVSAAHQDVARTAVAVDGARRLWVFWSANRNGNFDIYAKFRAGGRWSQEIRLTDDPGTDLNPVAATDRSGRVWVAWQAYRRNNLEVLAAVQQGERFSREATVSFSPASDWDPAIATAPNGEVAVAWDTYDKGDYDVYFRRLRSRETAASIEMDPPVPVAASQNFEARSSIAYDPQNRLWVAYEVAGTKWGKDFGAYKTSGEALDHGHTVKVRCFASGRVFEPTDDLAGKFPGATDSGLFSPNDKVPRIPNETASPNPDLARLRAPNQMVQHPALPQISFPRIAVDSAGMVYLAFRFIGRGSWVAPLGSPWFEDLVYFDGEQWRGPVFIPRSDGLLDSRPAATALAPGRLLLVTAMDHRQSLTPQEMRKASEHMDFDLYAADLRIASSPVKARLKEVPAEIVAPPPSETKPEVEQVAMMRAYRAQPGGQKLQLLRGEFHRHTEYSPDGGRWADGPLIDAYRYMIDAAYMDWVGCCDHDNGTLEYPWWIEQKLTDAYKLDGKFVPMFSYERSVVYPEGHRNVVFAQRGIRPLPRLPKMKPDSPPTPAPDTQMLYRYLRQFHGIVASHSSGTNMGTDWRDNDSELEPVVEIYQGDRQSYERPGAPRANSAGDSIGGWRPLGFVSAALQKGYRLGFEASSDHSSTHMSYCNLWVTAPTREAIMEAFRKRHVYGATDNILADVRSGSHFMGEEFTVHAPPSISVRLWGTSPFARVVIVKDNQYVYSMDPGKKYVEFEWKDGAAEKGRTSYYYVRGEQTDGELVWVSPMWITWR